MSQGVRDVLSSGSVVRTAKQRLVNPDWAKTYFGRTTELVQLARPKLHIEAVVAKVVRWLFVIVSVLLVWCCAVTDPRRPLIGYPAPARLVDDAVPVALPVMFTVSMAVARRSGEARRVGHALSAARMPPTMDVLWWTKTGTITMNQLAVTAYPAGAGDGLRRIVRRRTGVASSQSDPIDLAFLAAAKERHVFDNAPAVTPISFTR